MRLEERVESQKHLGQSEVVVRINGLPLKYASLSLVLAGAGLLTVQAGDAILFPGDKVKPDTAKIAPDKQGPAAKEAIKSWNNLPAATPRNLEFLPVPSVPVPRRASKDERQLKNERDEKRNWLLLRPGQLDEEDEMKEDFGMPDPTLDQDEETGQRDYTFHGLREGRDSQSGAVGSRPDRRVPGQAKKAATRPVTIDDSDSSEKKKPSNTGAAHQSKDLAELRGMLSPEQPDSPFKSGVADNPLKSALGSDSIGRSRARQQRMNEFGQMLNGPLSASGNNSLASTWKPGFDRPPSTPAFTRPVESAPRSSLSPFSPSAGLGAGSASRNAFNPGLPTAGSQNVSPSRNVPSSFGRGSLDQQPAQRPSVLRPTVLEIPQRR